MRTAPLIKVVLASCMLLAAPVSYAGFSTYSKDWPDDAETVDEKVSATPQETTTVEIVTDDTDKDEYAPNERISDYKRLYAKLGMTFLSAQLRKISNTSQPALSAGNVVFTDAKDDYVSWEFGLGTKFKYVRLEAEYLYEKQLPYNASPVFFGFPESVTSMLTTQAGWINVLYDLEKLNIPYFVPYIGASVGLAWNKTRTSMSGGIGTGAAKNHSRYSVGWGATIGLRIPFWTRWFGYFGYKYMDQGMARFEDSTGMLGLKGHSVVQGFDLGVQYLLG